MQREAKKYFEVSQDFEDKIRPRINIRTRQTEC